MSKEPSPDVVERAPLLLPPSNRLLVDGEYLLEQLLLENAAASGKATPATVAVQAEHAETMDGFGKGQRNMRFAHVRLFGLIRTGMAAEVTDALNVAFADGSIDGVLLEVNTGGGDAVASQMIRATVQGRSKPVVAYAHYQASGGTLATMDADEVIASGPMARFGSVGVMMTLPKWLAKAYGNYFEDIYAATSPDKNTAFRQYLKSMETDGFQSMLDELDGIFMSEMAAARPLPAATRASTLAGGTWLAGEAKQRGLVDTVGNFQFAIHRLALATQNYSQA